MNPYHAIDEETIEFVYDVYISYDPFCEIVHDYSLDKFVKDHVLPHLKNRGFRVTIREGLQSGRDIGQVISEALRGSRKVIAFVSTDYCVDYWNTFEFNMGVHEGMYTKRDVVIPIRFGDILDGDLNPEIALYMKSDNYPTFTGNMNHLAEVLQYLEDQIRR